ncbi:MAG: TatD family hydrolase [Chloroflexota bacterium]
MLIDSHCHLNFNAFDEDRDEVITRAKEAGIVAFINPATNLTDSQQITKMSEVIPELYGAVGFHPNDAAAFNDEALHQLKQLAHSPKIVSIGEIGLDYYWDKAPRPVQQRVFESQLELAKETNKPVIIHQRESGADTMAILRQWGADGQHPGLVLHSFSGDQAMMEAAIDLGFYIGISGPVTFKNARGLPDVVAAAPANRLLVETDAPFLTPHPFRGKRNEPARVKLITERIAELQQKTFTDMSRQLTQNTQTLFKLDIL